MITRLLTGELSLPKVVIQALLLSLMSQTAMALTWTDEPCWGTVPGDPTQYELIVRPVAGIHIESFNPVLEQFGLTGCKGGVSVTGTCIAFERKGDGSNPARTAQLLMEKRTKDGGPLFESVVPNAPIHLVGLVHEGAPITHSGQDELVALHAQAAWKAMPSGPMAEVALIDSGVYWDHPDLKSNLKKKGQDFTCPLAVCAGLPADTDGHGTHLAGVIAASGDDGGVFGVAPHAGLRPARISGDPYTLDWQGGEAIRWATDQRIKVINASWNSECELPHVLEQLRYARQNDVVFVTAAGNEDVDLDQHGHERYPAMYVHELPNVIVVMGHKEDNTPMANTNFGHSTVDIAAPGGAETTKICDANGCYERLTGRSTSVATAYVSGAAALVKTKYPQWPATWIKTQLVESGPVECSLARKSRRGARLMLDSAVLGPLSVDLPAAGAHWHPGGSYTVKWSNSYTSSLCTQITVSLMSGHSPKQELLTGIANHGVATVRLPKAVSQGAATLLIECAPAGFSASSGEIQVMP